MPWSFSIVEKHQVSFLLPVWLALYFSVPPGAALLVGGSGTDGQVTEALPWHL